MEMNDLLPDSVSEDVTALGRHLGNAGRILTRSRQSLGGLLALQSLLEAALSNVKAITARAEGSE